MDVVRIKPDPLPQRRKLIPTFSIDDKNFNINGRPFSLKRKPLTARLLAAFLKAPGLPLTKNNLMDVIYGAFSPREKSPRFQKILNQNLNKLVSRARLQLDEAYNSKHRWIDFLVYDPSLDGWNLYRLRNDYIARHSPSVQDLKLEEGAEEIVKIAG